MTSANLPRHIAIVMDGNGRWAKQRHMPRKMGHRAGAKAVRKLIETCAQKGIKVLTLFAFSSENWNRPQDEVQTLMGLFLSNLEKELPTLQENNIRLRVIGDRSLLNSELQQRIAQVEADTQQYHHMNLVLAVSYGGRWDITQAVKKLCSQAIESNLDVANITESDLQKYLSIADLPDPDLFIRTSGEQRLSNFLIWQLAYSELVFIDKLWPDFNADDLELALQQYQQRERRFGLTAEQLRGE